MNSYKDIFQLHVKNMDYLLAKTILSHQYMKNIGHAGAELENAVRDLFSQLLPRRFKVTHGYIISAPDQRQEPLISPQIDMLVVDTLVPHSIFVMDERSGMELVPKEAVVGVFEIKRTLDPKILQEAVQHIGKIKVAIGFDKESTDRYGPGGLQIEDGLSGGVYTNPLFGVLGIQTDKQLLDEDHPKNITSFINLFNKSSLDFVGTFTGLFCAVSDSQHKGDLRIANPRLPDEESDYVVLDNRDHQVADLVARMFGYILGYLHQTSGKACNVNNYYFNRSIQ